jgi:hypothetical protein
MYDVFNRVKVLSTGNASEAGQLVAEYGTDSYGSSNTSRDHVWLGSLPTAILNKGDNASVINY